MSAESFHLYVKVIPAGLFATDENFEHSGEFCRSLFSLCRYVAVSGADDSLYLSCLVSVCKIVFNELICGGNCDSSYLMKREHAEPELVMTLEHEHNSIPFFDTERLEVVSGFRRILLHITKGKAAVGFIVCHPKHSTFVGSLFSNSVNAVEGKVEFVLVFEFDATEDTLVVIEGFYEVVCNGFLILFFFCRFGSSVRYFGIFLAYKSVLRIENYSVELTATLTYGNHTVRNKAVVENGVTLVKDVNAVAYLHLERALYYYVKLLTVVRV